MSLEHLFESNRKWADQMRAEEPDFFEKLVHVQAPKYLWIGCSDSRVPANQIVGLLPGEVFVHRNVANVVVHTDFNCLSVIQYAVEILQIEHIVVCGHYGCGGVAAAMQPTQLGLIDNWLRHIKDVYRLHSHELDRITDQEQKVNRLVELNVTEQAYNLCKTTIVQNAWKDRDDLFVHGWIVDISTGLIKDLGVITNDSQKLGYVYEFESTAAPR